MPGDRERAAPPLALDARQLFGRMDEPVSVFTNTGVYEHVNAAGLRVLGTSLDAVLGRTYMDLYPDLPTHPFHAAFQRVANHESDLERLEFYYEPLRGWSNQRIIRVGDRVVVIWDDVTARKESEIEAAEQRMYRTVVETLPELAWTARPDGHIDYYNPRWYEYTGSTPEQMEGWGWQAVHDPAFLPNVMTAWQRSIATGQPFEMEFPLRRRDGVYRWFITRVVPLRDPEGRLVRWVGLNTDIDVQRTALLRLDDTLESMGDAFFLLDPEWRIVAVNRKQEEVSQTQRDLTRGRIFWDVFPATAHPTTKYWVEYHRVMQERVPAHFTEYYEPLDIWTEVDAYPSRDGGVAVFFRDVSERKRNERALSEERAVLEAIFREAPVGLALFDGELRCLRVNAVLAEMNGLTVDAHFGRAIHEVLTDSSSVLVEQCQRVLRTGVPVVGAELVSTGAGVTRVLRASYFPVAINAAVSGLGAVLEDITERRQAELERQRSTATIQLLAEASAALVSSLDYRETFPEVARLAVPRFADLCVIYRRDRDGTVEQVAAHDRSAEQAEPSLTLHRHAPLPDDLTFGYPKVLRTGRTELIAAVTDAIYEDPALSEFQRSVLRSIGAHSWIVAPMIAEGQPLGAIAFAVTTKRRAYSEDDVPVADELGRRAALALENAELYRATRAAYEAERAARDRAEEAARLKDEFLATLSHELRTPLNAILGWGRLLTSGKVDETKRDYALDVIVRNALSQNSLIDDLLDVSRIITGKLRLTVESVDIGHVTEVAIDTVRPAANAKAIRLQVVIDPAAGPISGDPDRLQQVASNLLTNAVKFTPRGGRVMVRVAREESHVALSVADTGVGISEEFLPYVFDRFRQQDGAISRRAGGLGLGLAIVKNLVELHGGTIEVQSDGPNQGSTFTAKFPIAPLRASTIAPALPVARPSERQPRLSCPPGLAGLRVLVIDDEPDARDLVATMLEQCGTVVQTVGDVPEALRQIVRWKPDVIVADIGMPGEDGYSFISKVRELPREHGGRTPALALTAYARAEDRTRALTAGFQSHAAKPIEPQELLLVVASLANRA